MKKVMIAATALVIFASCSKSTDQSAAKVEAENESTVSANEWNAQKVYYRIKATDKSGKVTYSTVQSVMETKP